MGHGDQAWRGGNEVHVYRFCRTIYAEAQNPVMKREGAREGRIRKREARNPREQKPNYPATGRKLGSGMEAGRQGAGGLEPSVWGS